MREFILKIKDSAAVGYIKDFLSSDYFPFITAALSLICYYLGLDVLMIVYIGITGALIFLLLDDVSPVFTVFLFMGIIISMKNSPSSSRGGSDYYYRPVNLTFIIFAVTVFVAAIVYRLVNTCVTKKFKLTPVFFGLCAFSVALLLNGANQKDYDIKNLMFSGMMAAFFLVIFAAVKDNLRLNKRTYEKIAMSFIAFGLALIVELLVIYMTVDGVIENGHIVRKNIIWGWGVYTLYGFYTAFCIPAALYLAGVKKYGFIYNIISVLLLAACFFSCCRQAIIFGTVIYVACLIMLFVKGGNRKSNAVTTAAAFLVLAVFFAVKYKWIIDEIDRLFSNFIVNGELNGSGRMELFRNAIANFKNSPIFGVGFYVNLANDPKKGFQFIPSMYHNTILQMMGACGIVGLTAYCVHRVQTVISYFKNITVERTFIAFTILVILLTSLVDHHIFNIFPTMVYSCLIAVLVKSESKTEEPVPINTGEEQKDIQ